MTKIFIVVLLIAVVIGCGFAATGEWPSTDGYFADPNRGCDNCVPFDFRWLQKENVLYSEKIRHIEIFLDPKAFNEANLKKLFGYLSSANPGPEGLTILVHTDWAQLGPAAPNCLGTGISEQPADPHEYDYLQATYWRRGQREYFRYSPKAKIDQSQFITVFIHQ